MAQNGLATKHSVKTSRSHSKYFNPRVSTYLKPHFNRYHGNALNKKLVLNRYEKRILSVGITVIMGMMFLLVAVKVTNGAYQTSIMRSENRITKVKSHVSTLRQETSDLQRRSRFDRIAHQHNLKFLGKNVRNVK